MLGDAGGWAGDGGFFRREAVQYVRVGGMQLHAVVAGKKHG